MENNTIILKEDTVLKSTYRGRGIAGHWITARAGEEVAYRRTQLTDGRTLHIVEKKIQGIAYTATRYTRREN